EVAVVDDQERPQEAVPRPHERQHGKRSQRRARYWQHDAGERAERTGAVDGRSLLKLLRDRKEELPHEEGAEGAEHTGDYQSCVGVTPSESGDDYEEGRDDDRERDHERGQVEREQGVAAA